MLSFYLHNPKHNSRMDDKSTPKEKMDSIVVKAAFNNLKEKMKPYFA